MTDDAGLTAILTELASIANAAMTADQRAQRAAPVLTAAGITVADIAGALQRPDLEWNADKARALGLDADAWQLAMSAGGQTPETIPQLLDHLHRAESAAAMIKAGYRPSNDSTGKLTWARD